MSESSLTQEENESGQSQSGPFSSKNVSISVIGILNVSSVDIIEKVCLTWYSYLASSGSPPPFSH